MRQQQDEPGRFSICSRQAAVVLIWNDAVYGWKNCLRDPQHERPGAIAIDSSEHIFIAEGGNEYDGSKCWVVLENKKELI
ncbi:antirestriction protein ArdR [Escherichia coli]|uniref:antirestriction protein ArdR n=1 Tax=Escherichia coli TaxID=562 RepID=UPI00140EB6C6|nr:antirestriction protein ArdR [Escherichia coli]QIM40630.1 antirestriction protein ArdR [Escherichia coli]